MQTPEHGYGFATASTDYRLDPTGPASVTFRTAHQGADECFKSGLPFIDGLPSSTRPSSYGLLPGTVVELHGPQSSGKSEVVLNLIASYVLPKRLQGFGRSVVFLDLDLCFKVARLQALLQAKAVNAEGEVDEAAVSESLSRVLLARCFSEVEILATLEIVRGQPCGEPMLLVIDSLAPLYYSAKLTESCGSERCALHNSIYRAILCLATQSAVTVLAVKPCLLVPKRLRDELGPFIEHREFMPKMWRSIVTHRLMMCKEEHVAEEDSLDPSIIAVRVAINVNSTSAPPVKPVYRLSIGPTGILECEEAYAEHEMPQ